MTGTAAVAETVKNMMQHGVRNLALTAGLLGALALGASACKEAQAKTKGVGDSFRAFIIQNCETNESYCQVCAYGGKPTIMTVVDIDDPGAKEDLAQIQKIVSANEAKGLTAFALFGKIEAGKFESVPDDEAALKKLKALHEELALTYPLTIIPKKQTEKQTKGYAPFVAQYDIAKSRTVLAAEADNKIFFAETMSGDAAQYEKLAKAVEAKL